MPRQGGRSKSQSRCSQYVLKWPLPHLSKGFKTPSLGQAEGIHEYFPGRFEGCYDHEENRIDEYESQDNEQQVDGSFYQPA